MNLEDRRLPDLAEHELERLRQYYRSKLVAVEMELQQRSSRWNEWAQKAAYYQKHGTGL